ncbi:MULTISPECIES: phosphoribosylformylglycinamidine synthase subunit PurS [Thermotoga]|uniref:Phosphoribosylformylglycinamidine synthase subunit PurS n=1 Tax=Thermotoga neapolitana (strain ATCC 49049 / DSM 4359 / NBRC 107923 / NS-E) TaxID=309803 RepID=B9K973_THENN|nr:MULTISPECIES: phosphoribosylformylglycinamidine synthase subunit PurS [Thermotoga]MDK2786201.1 phosphoribosylformylglycinamidine synthase subunit PurS [Thermotoga sp.]HBF10169.1 phosphoribosylformylglycinamidine synthase, purS protein [Thermotoga neapolitana]ACM23506.1 Phosphoribosylformylglycinamidine synthase, purS [Thermotoga neapolitana DSM 4359]AJG41408.1 phosphoribosylformylglycinamidine synthase [Thermotoga sp. RQ7]MDK2949850.1 phosphoribosylformylglycinamidine synthase subunit PurS 
MPIFKFAVDVQYRSNIRDPRGETIERVLREEKNLPVKRLRLGKSIHLEVEAEDREKAYEIVKRACEELLVNPVVEEYEVREL